MKKMLMLISLLCICSSIALAAPVPETSLKSGSSSTTSDNKSSIAKKHSKTANSRKHHYKIKKQTPVPVKQAVATPQPLTLALEQAIDNDNAAIDSFHSEESTTSRIIATVNHTVANITHNSYKFGGNYFNAIKGIYKLDCSSYVGQVLKIADPSAYASITDWARVYKPVSRDYYAFFQNIPLGQVWNHWAQIQEVANLRAGDILVFRYKGRSSGHVMIVMDNPIQTDSEHIFQVRVADSAPSGHSDDTRPVHSSGVGIGTLLLKVNPKTGEPYAYAWKADAPWKYDSDFAMARPA